MTKYEVTMRGQYDPNLPPTVQFESREDEVCASCHRNIYHHPQTKELLHSHQSWPCMDCPNCDAVFCLAQPCSDFAFYQRHRSPNSPCNQIVLVKKWLEEECGRIVSQGTNEERSANKQRCPKHQEDVGASFIKSHCQLATCGLGLAGGDCGEITCFGNYEMTHRYFYLKHLFAKRMFDVFLETHFSRPLEASLGQQLDLLSKDVADTFYVRHRIPFSMFRLNMDDHAFHFIKRWTQIGSVLAKTKTWTKVPTLDERKWMFNLNVKLPGLKRDWATQDIVFRVALALRQLRTIGRVIHKRHIGLSAFKAALKKSTIGRSFISRGQPLSEITLRLNQLDTKYLEEQEAALEKHLKFIHEANPEILRTLMAKELPIKDRGLFDGLSLPPHPTDKVTGPDKEVAAYIRECVGNLMADTPAADFLIEKFLDSYKTDTSLILEEKVNSL